MNLNSINFSDLETKGFLVIQNFLDKQEISEVTDIYSEILNQYQNTGSVNKNYSILRGTLPANILVNARKLLEVINQKTNLKTNLITNQTADYLDNQLLNFGWHQDHESYFKWQNAYNDLNFWIAISKPSETEAGLQVIPQNELAYKNLTIFEEQILGKGAKLFLPSTNSTIIHDTETGQVTTLPFSINDLSYTPTLFVGDLLLLRGDLIHKSQSSTVPRLAISFRAINKNQILSKKKFYGGSIKKQVMIFNHLKAFQPIIDAFETKDFFTVEEIL
jgi:hypothetical protein